MPQTFSNLGKFSEINKQFHVKSWLIYRSYSSVWWILGCTDFSRIFTTLYYKVLVFPHYFFYFQKVSYVHDGSESTQDAVIFEIELSSSRPNSLDKEMRVRQRFRLQISIRPHNDVPKIEMGPALKGKYLKFWKIYDIYVFLDFIFYFLGGKALRIASGTTKLLNDDLINVLDPDSTKAEISITLVPASGKILLTFFPKKYIFF